MSYSFSNRYADSESSGGTLLLAGGFDSKTITPYSARMGYSCAGIIVFGKFYFCYCCKWKRWGVYGFVGSALVASLVNIISVGILFALFGLVGVVILGFLLRPTWHQMD